MIAHYTTHMYPAFDLKKRIKIINFFNDPSFLAFSTVLFHPIHIYCSVHYKVINLIVVRKKYIQFLCYAKLPISVMYVYRRVSL